MTQMCTDFLKWYMKDNHWLLSVITLVSFQCKQIKWRSLRPSKVTVKARTRRFNIVLLVTNFIIVHCQEALFSSYLIPYRPSALIQSWWSNRLTKITIEQKYKKGDPLRLSFIEPPIISTYFPSYLYSNNT